jgi:hypothetical protein
MQTTIDTDLLKKTFKEAIAETLHEERGFLHDIIVEVIEEIALSEAIREGLNTKLVERDAVFRLLEGER